MLREIVESVDNRINELKIGFIADEYLELVRNYLGSKNMEVETVSGKLEVKYDYITLVFDNSGYLIGFKEFDEYFEVDTKLKSIKDLKKSTVQKFLGRNVRSSKLKKTKTVLSYFPKTNEELRNLMETLNRGNKADLNDIDVSGVEDMSDLFYGSEFNGDISKWDVGNVEDMSSMFTNSEFNGDISKWDVGNVRNMSRMFNSSKFDRDISKWDVGNVRNMRSMFTNSKFNGDISKWDVWNVEDMSRMFYESEFNGDISKWDVSNVRNMSDMFHSSKFDGDISKWDVTNVEDMTFMFHSSPLEGNEPSWYKED